MAGISWQRGACYQTMYSDKTAQRLQWIHECKVLLKRPCWICPCERDTIWDFHRIPDMLSPLADAEMENVKCLLWIFSDSVSLESFIKTSGCEPTFFEHLFIFLVLLPKALKGNELWLVSGPPAASRLHTTLGACRDYYESLFDLDI